MEILFSDTTSTPKLDEYLEHLAADQDGVTCTVRPSYCTGKNDPKRRQITLVGQQIRGLRILYQTTDVETQDMDITHDGEDAILCLTVKLP